MKISIMGTISLLFMQSLVSGSPCADSTQTFVRPHENGGHSQHHFKRDTLCSKKESQTESRDRVENRNAPNPRKASTALKIVTGLGVVTTVGGLIFLSDSIQDRDDCKETATITVGCDAEFGVRTAIASPVIGLGLITILIGAVGLASD